MAAAIFLPLHLFWLCSKEMQMNSVERVMHYCTAIPQEPSAESIVVSPSWPEYGSIVCTLVSFSRYLFPYSPIHSGRPRFGNSVPTRIRSGPWRHQLLNTAKRKGSCIPFPYYLCCLCWCRLVWLDVREQEKQHSLPLFFEWWKQRAGVFGLMVWTFLASAWACCGRASLSFPKTQFFLQGPYAWTWIHIVNTQVQI